MGERNGRPLQYFCLENPMGGGAWWATLHRVSKSRTQLGDFTFTFHSQALEKGMATHSSLLAWRIPWTEGSPKPLFKVSTPLVRGDSQRFLCSWALEHSSVSEASTGFLRHHLRNPHQEAVSPRVSGFNLSPQELWPLPSGLCSCQTLLFLCSFLPHPWQQPGL